MCARITCSMSAWKTDEASLWDFRHSRSFSIHFYHRVSSFVPFPLDLWCNSFPYWVHKDAATTASLCTHYYSYYSMVVCVCVPAIQVIWLTWPPRSRRFILPCFTLLFGVVIRAGGHIIQARLLLPPLHMAVLFIYIPQISFQCFASMVGRNLFAPICLFEITTSVANLTSHWSVCHFILYFYWLVHLHKSLRLHCRWSSQIFDSENFFAGSLRKTLTMVVSQCNIDPLF